MKRKSKLLVGLLCIAVSTALMFAPGIASAQTLGQIAQNVNNSIQNVTSLAGAIGYMVGAFFLLGAIFKFKQHGDNPEQYPIRTPIFLLITAVLAVTMTAVLTSGKETIFGAGATGQGSTGSALMNGL